jgi:hypothetical protein
MVPPLRGALLQPLLALLLGFDSPLEPLFMFVLAAP